MGEVLQQAEASHCRAAGAFAIHKSGCSQSTHEPVAPSSLQGLRNTEADAIMTAAQAVVLICAWYAIIAAGKAVVLICAPGCGCACARHQREKPRCLAQHICSTGCCPVSFS
jgi:hypothetical protein